MPLRNGRIHFLLLISYSSFSVHLPQLLLLNYRISRIVSNVASSEPQADRTFANCYIYHGLRHLFSKTLIINI